MIIIIIIITITELYMNIIQTDIHFKFGNTSTTVNWFK